MSTYPVNWRKSSYSMGNNNCVELADNGERILLRDSKDPGGGHLPFARSELAAFVAACRAGEPDDLY
jgi:hypothetical protein